MVHDNHFRQVINGARLNSATFLLWAVLVFSDLAGGCRSGWRDICLQCTAEDGGSCGSVLLSWPLHPLELLSGWHKWWVVTIRTLFRVAEFLPLLKIADIAEITDTLTPPLSVPLIWTYVGCIIQTMRELQSEQYLKGVCTCIVHLSKDQCPFFYWHIF